MSDSPLIPPRQSDEPLSPRGEARRDAMLDGLLGAMAAHQRAVAARRRAATIGAAAFVLAGAVGLSLVYRPNQPSHGTIAITHAPPPGASAAPGAPAPAPVSAVVMVRTDPTITGRWSLPAPQENVVARFTPPPASTPIVAIRIIDDEELIGTLAAMGRPSGIIRMEGRTRLSAAVTDAELEAKSKT